MESPPELATAAIATNSALGFAVAEVTHPNREVAELRRHLPEGIGSGPLPASDPFDDVFDLTRPMRERATADGLADYLDA